MNPIFGSESAPRIGLSFCSSWKRFLRILDTGSGPGAVPIWPRASADFTAAAGPFPTPARFILEAPRACFLTPWGAVSLCPWKQNPLGPRRMFPCPRGPAFGCWRNNFQSPLWDIFLASAWREKGSHTSFFKNDQLVCHTLCFIYVMGETPLPSCISNTKGCKMAPLWCHRGLTNNATTNNL